MSNMYNHTHETIKEPQLPKHECGLDVTSRVTRCTGRVSANTRPHQLRWGDSGSVGATWHAHATQMAGLMMNGSRWWLDGSPPDMQLLNMWFIHQHQKLFN